MARNNNDDCPPYELIILTLITTSWMLPGPSSSFTMIVYSTILIIGISVGAVRLIWVIVDMTVEDVKALPIVIELGKRRPIPQADTYYRIYRVLKYRLFSWIGADEEIDKPGGEPVIVVHEPLMYGHVLVLFRGKCYESRIRFRRR